MDLVLLGKWFKTCVIVIGFFVLFGCGDDGEIEPLPDTTAPVLEVTPSLDLERIIFGQVEFGISVSDESEIVNTDFLVNDAVLLSTSENNHVFILDTKTIGDGIHTIKLNSTDADGNSTVKEYVATVRNVLYRFTIGESYISPSRRRWIYLSSHDGAVLDVQEMSNGAKLEFKLPSGHTQDSEYSFTLVDYLSSASYNQVTLATMVAIAPGDFIQDVLATFSYKGSHYLKVANIDAANVISAGSIGANIIFNSLDKDVPNNSIKITTRFSSDGLHDLAYFIREAGNEPKYLKVEGVSNDETTEVDVLDFLPMLNHTINVPGAKESYYKINYITDISNIFGGGPSTAYYSEDPEEVVIYYPGINYPLYSTTLFADFGGLTYTYSETGTQIATNFEFLEASISQFNKNDKVLNGTTTGNYDFLRLLSSKPESFPGDLNITLSITMMPSSEFQFTITDIPDEIIGSIPGLAGYVPNFNRIIFNEYSGMDGFDDYVKLRFETNKPLETDSDKVLVKDITF